MSLFTKSTRTIFALCVASLGVFTLHAADTGARFKVIAFYTGKDDKAHISFVTEANRWFPQQGSNYNFSYESTSNWNDMTPEKLAQYQVVLFLDTRPDGAAQRAAFQSYMEHGGAWMGFHFAAFALTPSAYPQNWDWYHDTFLGADQYVSNTWRPVSAILHVDDTNHPATKGLSTTIKSAPCEWYRWKANLRTNADIDVLLSVDPSSFPLGTGPKLYEIWHSGDYPIVWSNKKFHMIYMNMGHNDMDYEHKYDNTNKSLSSTFQSEDQDKLIINSLLWLGGRK